jgi:hypothetical protein
MPASAVLLRGAREDPEAIFVLGICSSCVVAAGGQLGLWPRILPILREVSPGLKDITSRIVDTVGSA